LPHTASSGWHLHHSIEDSATGCNLFPHADGLSKLARGWLGGLLRRAAAATAFSTPTINGYKRYMPNSMAPDHVVWAYDNRAAMVRVVGQPDDPATRLENRVGEPAANPYLYMASQIAAGLDGIATGADPGPSADTPYSADAPTLPKTLMDAIAALRDDACFRSAFGDRFVDYFVHLKEFEIGRFLSAVTDWEHRGISRCCKGWRQFRSPTASGHHSATKPAHRPTCAAARSRWRPERRRPSRCCQPVLSAVAHRGPRDRRAPARQPRR